MFNSFVGCKFGLFQSFVELIPVSIHDWVLRLVVVLPAGVPNSEVECVNLLHCSVVSCQLAYRNSRLHISIRFVAVEFHQVLHVKRLFGLHLIL